MLCVLAGCAAAFAANPPALVNYQGVLRDASDKPLDPPGGTVNMVFRFYDADTAGTLLLADQHADVSGNAVGVTKGLFNTWLGGGTISGPYTSLEGVFRDYPIVWLSIQVGAETLSPRVRIVSAAYALNASNLGGRPASDFIDTSSSTQTKTGALAVEIASGDYGRLAYAQRGVDAAGSEMGGHFIDTNGGSDAELAVAGSGIRASGPYEGGWFYDSDSSGYAHVGSGDAGISAYGNSYGGYFQDLNNSSFAYLGYGTFGVYGYGSDAGGYFDDSDSSGYAYVGSGDTGIQAHGNAYGGLFTDLDQSGRAVLAQGNTGVNGYGSVTGGYFDDTDSTGFAYLAYGDYGIQASGSFTGGYFSDQDSSAYAYAALGDEGIRAGGASRGGFFSDSDNSGFAYVGNGDYGIMAYGTTAGGYFGDSNTSGYAYVGYSTYKAYSTQTNSFVQNHPLDKERVIVYASPEGDEVAVYTRGTARLVNGEARVNLGATFRYVTNPDIGLTVYVTPVGAWSDLYVASKGTDEIVVKSHGGDPGAVFDYIVYGLRIGFEESSIVQEKMIESYIPSMKDHRELYSRKPELRAYNALERFKAMWAGIGQPTTDLSKSDALKAAIHEYDPATDPPTCELFGMGPCREEVTLPTLPPKDPAASAEAAGGPVHDGSAATSPPPVSKATLVAGAHPREDGVTTAKEPSGTIFPVSEPVEAGDLVVLDPLHPGFLVRAATAGDTGVVGIAIGPADTTADGALQAPVAVYGVVQIKVDSAYGVVRPGDLLVTSATAGHAMKAPEVIVAGTVIGKALESLESGSGVIKVLVMLR